jgi:hypothetical protein
MDAFFDATNLILVGGLLAGYFLVIPLLTKFTYRLEARTTLELLDIDTGLDGDAGQYLIKATEQLTELAFNPICMVDIPQMVPNARACLKLFIHPQHQDEAAIEVYFLKQSNEWKQHSMCVEFSTEYSDGTVVTTGNAKVFSVWPIADYKTISQFPKANDLKWLYEAHTAICTLKALGKRKTIDLYTKYNGDAVSCLADAMDREHGPAVEAGYLYLLETTARQDRAGTLNPYAPPSSEAVPARYGATFKGAYIMTWQLLWPISILVKRQRMRRSRQRLAQAGFTKPIQ